MLYQEEMEVTLQDWGQYLCCLRKLCCFQSIAVSPGIQLQRRDVASQLSMDPNSLLN